MGPRRSRLPVNSYPREESIANIALFEARLEPPGPRHSARNLRDAGTAGFSVRVQPSAAWRLFVHTRHRGARIWKIVGNANAMALPKARTRAASMLAEIRRHGDPPVTSETTRCEAVSRDVCLPHAHIREAGTLRVD